MGADSFSQIGSTGLDDALWTYVQAGALPANFDVTPGQAGAT